MTKRDYRERVIIPESDEYVSFERQLGRRTITTRVVELDKDTRYLPTNNPEQQYKQVNASLKV